MANIAILNYCNLKCEYCFADDMFHEESSAVTLEDFQKILEFTAKVPGMNHIGIIGGEPTLHPQFDEILKEVNRYCKECETDATLFTNGIMLEEHLPYIGDRIGILINYNNPADMPKTLADKLAATLEHLNDLSWFDRKVNLGCNVHMNCTDYSYMWDIVKKYKINHIRCSVCSPGGVYWPWREKKEEYYNTMKPIFIQFCKDAIKHNCRLGMDCGHIPMCYFTLEEKEIVQEACDGLYQDFCEPVVDITTDSRATACFGAYDPVDIRDFTDLMELHRFLMAKKTLPRAAANCTGRCSTCKKHKLLQCQGGCLGFAQV